MRSAFMGGRKDTKLAASEEATLPCWRPVLLRKECVRCFSLQLEDRYKNFLCLDFSPPVCFYPFIKAETLLYPRL